MGMDRKELTHYLENYKRLRRKHGGMEYGI